ncbi:DUF5677 domain-containing protein [Paenibacillus agaridevorans]|uniref:DUF5677 domain-containing protein n=1 Tax=Paenibacillus agaridevorans TaxID=171404 RepID=UPI001BE4D4AD|nr:DUF5677 domain-containing protein [Paenibacillus agaridevorans]
MTNSIIKKEIYDHWKNELDAINNPSFAPAYSYKNLILLLQTCEILTSHIKVRRISKVNQLQMISRFMMAHIFQLGSGSYRLTKSGLGSPALILGRSILESLIDMTYLWLCKDIHGTDVERNAWADYYKISRYSVYSHWEAYKNRMIKNGKVVDELFEPKAIKNIVMDFDNFKLDYPHAGNKMFWAKESSLLKRAQLLDKTGKLQNGFPNKQIDGFPHFSFEEEYITIYKHTSEYAHGESGSMQSLFEVDSKDNAEIILFGSSSKNIVIANALVANYLLIFSYIFAHINNLDLHFIPKELDRHGFIIPTNEKSNLQN